MRGLRVVQPNKLQLFFTSPFCVHLCNQGYSRPYTKKPLQVGLGTGMEEVKGWVATIRPKTRLFELKIELKIVSNNQGNNVIILVR